MNPHDDSLANLSVQAAELGGRLRGLADADTVAQGRQLVAELRRHRLFPEMTRLAEMVSRNAPKDATTRKHYAQGLIEGGQLTAAVDVLTRLSNELPREDAEWAEAVGLQGRAHKQIFVEAEDKTSDAARAALDAAITCYRLPYEANPTANTWHGINLVALLNRARKLKLPVAPDLNIGAVATQVQADLSRFPAQKQDHWFHATLAEAALASADWDTAEKHLGAYVQNSSVDAFSLGSRAIA